MLHTIPNCPPYPSGFRGDTVVAVFRLPLVLGDEFPFQALAIVYPAHLVEGAAVVTIGARKDDKHWTPLSEYSEHLGKNGLTNAWTEFQNQLAEIPGLPMKW